MLKVLASTVEFAALANGALLIGQHSAWIQLGQFCEFASQLAELPFPFCPLCEAPLQLPQAGSLAEVGAPKLFDAAALGRQARTLINQLKQGGAPLIGECGDLPLGEDLNGKAFGCDGLARGWLPFAARDLLLHTTLGEIGLLPTQAMVHAIALKLQLDQGVRPQTTCALAASTRHLIKGIELPPGFRIRAQAFQFAGALQHEPEDMDPGGFATATAADDGVEPRVEAKSGSGCSLTHATRVREAHFAKDKRRWLGGWPEPCSPLGLVATPTLHRTAVAIQQSETKALDGGAGHLHPGETGTRCSCPLEAMAVAAKHLGEIGRLLTDTGRKRVIKVLPLHGEQIPYLKQLLEGGGVYNAGLAALSNCKQGFPCGA